jgi:hypothetical protein
VAPGVGRDPPERIALDHVGELVAGAHHDVHGNSEVVGDRGFELAAQALGRS